MNSPVVSTGVAVLGLGLVAANTATGKSGASIRDVITGGTTSGTTAHNAWIAIFGQVLFVLVLAFLADWSPPLGTIIVFLLVGLWLVWATTHAKEIASVGKALGMA